MGEIHFVKIVTKGDPDKPNYRIYGYTDDDRTYIINKEILHLLPKERRT